MEKLNIAPFYVGQQVICINGSPAHGLIKDNIYTLTEVHTCSCGETTVSYGVRNNKPITFSSCYGCHTQFKVGSIYWNCRSIRFAPLQESKFKSISFEKINEEVEQLCVN